jgi:sortase A
MGAAGIEVAAPTSPPPQPSRPAPLGPLRRVTREIGLALITAGVVVLLFIGYQLWGTGIAEHHSQTTLQKGFNAPGAGHRHADPPTGGATGPGAAPGGAIDHLIIAKIHVDVFVVEGVTTDDLQQGPGHYPQTVLPGQDGNAAIAGHRTTYGAPFFSLNELGVGDRITLTDTSGRTFTYRVSEPPRSVSPTDVAVLDPTSFPQLTLTTCNPRYSATSRLIVVARITTGTALPASPSATPASPGPDTTSPAAPSPSAASVASLGSGNRQGWPPAIAYGSLVVLLWIGARLLINRTRRWHRAGAIVIGVAVCLVPLWFCFENVVRLLPQNI